MLQIKQIQNLNINERIELWSELWISIIRDADLPITEKEKRVLDERYEKFQKNPQRGREWDQIYKDL